MGEKSLAEAYILGIPFGLFGAHHFYLGRKFFGILYACTLGLLGIGYLYDLVRMKWLVRHANRYGTDKKMISDCYLVCALGGMFGAHHFYLENKKLGIFYACTLGVFTVGWIVDLVRMKHLVEDYNSKREEKSLGTAYILGLSPLGIFGSYHYYLGDVKLGLIYTFTLGIFGIGWIVDLFRMKKLVRKAGMDRKSVGTAYIMAMPPFGLFGAYHYYLGNYALGLTYTLTLGIFGMGWVVDLFRMKGLVTAANDPTSDHGMTKITAYVLCVSPLGIFGAHHFYLERYLNGGFFAATVGLFGVGWIFDILRLPVLYERYAGEDKHKYPDDAYLFWFPFGIFGLHHFYLERKKWGILYICTLGCFGFGWIIDGIRMSSLLRDYNEKVGDPDMVDFRICRPNCKVCSVYRCKACCLSLFSCACFENFSLDCLKTSDSTDIDTQTSTSNKRVKDDFDVINEMNANDNAKNHEHEMNEIQQPNGDAQGQISVAYIHDEYPTKPDGYDQGAHEGEPGYDQGAHMGDPEYDQGAHLGDPGYDQGAHLGDPGYDENYQSGYDESYHGDQTDNEHHEFPPPPPLPSYSTDGGEYQDNYTTDGGNGENYNDGYHDDGNKAYVIPPAPPLPSNLHGNGHEEHYAADGHYPDGYAADGQNPDGYATDGQYPDRYAADPSGYHDYSASVTDMSDEVRKPEDVGLTVHNDGYPAGADGSLDSSSVQRPNTRHDGDIHM